MSGILWIIISYLLGSLPFGYLISLTSRKNVLEIGWRKTSGSNVFRNVGKWQGVLTGILDVSKGYIAVYGAQKLGLSSEVQIFSGVAAVVGHNWSCFLKFSGGRGVGTFVGGFFGISSKILGLSLIPLILTAIIWNAAIGTLLFLAAAIFFSFYFYPARNIFSNSVEAAGLFAAISLAPILIKRLSPIKEIPQAKKPLVLIINRLLFDDDKGRWDFRIKQLFKSNSKDLAHLARFLFAPVLLPPKIGWQTAKLGVEIAKKPIQRLINFLPPEKVVTELKIDDLKNMMVASARKIVKHQEEINRINVWPVADRDTGYNLAATLIGIEGVISQKEYRSISELAQDIKDGAMINSRGNAGMIFTGYLIRFLAQIKNLETVDSFRLGLAMKKGIKAAYNSILNPIEGSILDVIKAAGNKAYEVSKIKKEKNIIKVLEEVQKASQKALDGTKDKLEVLRQNNVVDAGALGFAKILESWLKTLKGVAILPENGDRPIISEITPEKELEYQHDLVFRIKKIADVKITELKNELSLIGGSIDIIETGEQIKIHIHTNFTEKVKEKLVGFEILDWKTEDMIKQVRKISEKKTLGLVVEEAADLPKEFLEKNHIIEIPFLAKFPDGEVLRKENLFPKLKEAVKSGRPLPTTSAPSFKDFLSGFQKALDNFEEVLVITLSSKLSGAYSSARIARSMLEDKKRLTVFDCFTAEVGEGLVAHKVQELISQGKNRQEIIEFLKNFCPKVKLIGGLEEYNYLARSGRIRLPKIVARIISFLSKMGVQFLFEVVDGKVKFFKISFGQSLDKILVKEVKNAYQGKEKKAAIAYGENLAEALRLKKALEKEEKIKILYLSQVSTVVGVYTGPKVLIVGFFPE